MTEIQCKQPVKVVGCRIDKDGHVYLMLSNECEDRVLSDVVCQILLDHFTRLPPTYLAYQDGL